MRSSLPPSRPPSHETNQAPKTSSSSPSNMSERPRKLLLEYVLNKRPDAPDLDHRTRGRPSPSSHVSALSTRPPYGAVLPTPASSGLNTAISKPEPTHSPPYRNSALPPPQSSFAPHAAPVPSSMLLPPPPPSTSSAPMHQPLPLAQPRDLVRHSHTSAAPATTASSMASMAGSSATHATGQSESSERPFTCDICSRGFVERGNLNKHISSVHRKEKNKVCTEPGCGKSFAFRDGLLRHIAHVHQHQRLHSCSECGKSFKQASHLAKHLRSIHRRE